MDRLRFLARADIGGFDIGSDLSWQLAGYLSFQASDATSIVVGYRLLDIEYDEGSGADRFELDAQLRGPVIGAIFTF